MHAFNTCKFEEVLIITINHLAWDILPILSLWDFFVAMVATMFSLNQSQNFIQSIHDPNSARQNLMKIGQMVFESVNVRQTITTTDAGPSLYYKLTL